MNRRLIAPLVALLVTIAGVLAFAAVNRSDARQRLTVTERELSVPWQWQNESADDDGDVRLSLQWQRRGDALDERAWLTDGKLRELGFDVSVPSGAPEAERRYRRAMPRAGWVVFEYDGAAWRAMEQRRQLRVTAATPAAGIRVTRLVPIDAGRDREALMRRHASASTVILPALLRLGWLPAASGGPLMYGYVDRLVVDEVTVPKRLLGVLERFRANGGERAEADQARLPRYEVDLAVGRLGYPWVTGVRAIKP